MKRRTIWMLAAVVLGVLAFAVAGCGGDGGGSAAETTTEATTTETTTTTEATETTETTEATETTETTPSGSAFATAGNCAELAGLGQKISQAFSGSDANIQEVADDFQQLAAQAPSEIKADFQTIADAYSKIADALQGVDLSGGQVPSAAALAKLQKLSTEIDQAKLTQAAQNIATWVTQNCTS